jgi:ketosteroid isomerase-like protein
MSARRIRCHFYVFILCAAGVFSSGCRTGDDAERLEADIAAIKKFLASAGDAVNAGDVEAEVNRFTEDGIYMWPDAPSIKGHAALRTWFEERFAHVEVNLENDSEELEVCGDWAFERGRYVATVKIKSSGDLVTIRGKYLNVLKRGQDGSWRIARRIRNQDHP